MVDWFVPGYKAGGPIRSSVNLAHLLKHDYQVFVLTTDTDHGEAMPYTGIENNKWLYNIDSNIAVFYAQKKTLSFKQLTKEIQAINPDFIYLNHIFSPHFVLLPLWLKIRGLIHGNIVLCPRGGLYESAIKLKAYKKRPLLQLLKWLNVQKKIVFHATNTREKDAIKKYFPGSQTIIADNLPQSNQPPFATFFKQPGYLKCIFIARILSIKNLFFLITALQDVKANVALTIVGPVEDETYWQACKQQINNLPAHITIDYKGAISNDALIGLLQQHHLFVLPTTGENFGHSIFESFIAGRPVLISDQTPWLNLQSKNIGWDISLEDKDAFIDAIETIGSYNQDQFDALALSSWNFAQQFISNPTVKGQYLRLFS